jgi:hypothetical protein
MVMAGAWVWPNKMIANMALHGVGVKRHTYPYVKKQQ